MGDISKRSDQHTLARQTNIQKQKIRQKFVKNLTKVPIGKRTDISGDYGNKRFSLSCSNPLRAGWRKASWRECCPDHFLSHPPLPPRNRAPLAGVLFAYPEAGSARLQPRLYRNVFSTRLGKPLEIVMRAILTMLASILSRVADPDPHCFWMLDPDQH